MVLAKLRNIPISFFDPPRIQRVDLYSFLLPYLPLPWPRFFTVNPCPRRPSPQQHSPRIPTKPLSIFFICEAHSVGRSLLKCSMRCHFTDGHVQALVVAQGSFSFYISTPCDFSYKAIHFRFPCSQFRLHTSAIAVGVHDYLLISVGLSEQNWRKITPIVR